MVRTTCFIIVQLIALLLCQRDSVAGFIFAGNHTLLANTPNQVVTILASPSVIGEKPQGLNLNIVLDNGGAIVGGTDDDSPKIMSVNLKPTGGLFSSIPDSQTNVYVDAKLFQATIAPTNVLNYPTLTPDAILATVTLDTTGITSGSWTLKLTGIPAASFPETDFVGISTNLVNGSLSIVPEPASLSLLSTLGMGMILARRRLKKL